MTKGGCLTHLLVINFFALKKAMIFTETNFIYRTMTLETDQTITTNKKQIEFKILKMKK